MSLPCATSVVKIKVESTFWMNEWNWPEWSERERAQKQPTDMSRSSVTIWQGRDTCGRRKGCTRTSVENQQRPSHRGCDWWGPDSALSDSERWCWGYWPDIQPGTARGSNIHEPVERIAGSSLTPCRSSPFHHPAGLHWQIYLYSLRSNPDRPRWCWLNWSTLSAIRSLSRQP